MSHRGKIFIAALLSASYSVGVFADVWQPVTGSIERFGGSVIELFPAYAFEDGVSTERTIFEGPSTAPPYYSDYEFVFLDKPFSERFDAQLGFSFEGESWTGVPGPQVDLENGTIDVSSAFVTHLSSGNPHGYDDVYWPEYGGSGRALSSKSFSQSNPNLPNIPVPDGTPVPITANSDGSFTARWKTPSNFHGGNLYYADSNITFTFARMNGPTPPVPEPGLVWLFGIGLTALGIVARRKRHAVT